MFRFKKDTSKNKEFTHEELEDILTGVKELSMEELAMVWGGVLGDEREEYTLDETVINKDIFGTKFCG